MEKIFKFVKNHRIGFIAVLIGIAVLGVGVMVATQPMRDQAYMNEIVTGSQGRELIEARLRHTDKNALTSSGKIKSYKILEDTIKHDPMGGIFVRIEFNNDPDNNVTMHFSKDNSKGELMVYEQSLSAKAYKMYQELGAYTGK
ncbi:DUF1310 family protein [Alloscardovia theropitheci]|uniref:DUF1310 family protein n=1 Tax=Alloscardovia theropitheci TaxID=2496842 RepID=A0A4R0R1E8_9BIFI|nr:DUF1310 family protein [Alloscardovia theropitheci]TCD54966.1 DUF1310 family protein [Alloscardovia theropitheci]